MGEPPSLPACVLWPKSPEQIAQILRLCNAERISVLPFGAGSGVCGGARPEPGAVVLDLKLLKRIRRLEPERLELEAEAGIMGMRLERSLEARGLTLGHFPSSISCSTLGGWIAGRSAGQCSSRYGKIEDMVLDLEWVTAEGEICRTTRSENLQGLDWNQLLLGSEGTLGIVTAASLRLQPQPQTRRFQAWMMPQISDGLAVMRRIMQAGQRPAVLRLYDPLDTLMVGSEGQRTGRFKALIKAQLKGGWLLNQLLSRPKLLNHLAGRVPQRSLLIAISEGCSEEVARCGTQLQELAQRMGGEDLGEAPAQAWMKHRYDVSYKQSALYEGGAFVDTFEVAGTWARLPALYRGVKEALGDQVAVMAHFSHAYPGGSSIYFSLAGSAAHPTAMRERYDRAWRRGLDAVITLGGSIAHHHGAGISRAQHMGLVHGAGRQVFFALKRSLDPQGILNPGKLFLGAVPERPKYSPSSEGFLLIQSPEQAAEALKAVSGFKLGRVPEPGCLVLDLRGLSGLLSFDPLSHVARVAAGTSWGALEQALREKGATLGPIPHYLAPRMILESFAEDDRLRPSPRYGQLSDAALSLSAILAGGAQTRASTTPRRATGPDLARVILGAQHRAGLLVELHLQTWPLESLIPWGAYFPDWESALARALAPWSEAPAWLQLSKTPRGIRMAVLSGSQGPQRPEPIPEFEDLFEELLSTPDESSPSWRRQDYLPLSELPQAMRSWPEGIISDLSPRGGQIYTPSAQSKQRAWTAREARLFAELDGADDVS